MSFIIQNIPTNIITGFLGVGKTTAILHLLKHKPEHERWAVLVNEFGEVGIDGALIELGSGQEHVHIKEVPGGCMCCSAGLPMQVALNVLLKEAKPHRLLIEPTGLGHPKEVLGVLSESHYQNVLDVQHSITLVDATKIRDEKYTSHPIFTQQLEVADVVVANKADLYQPDDIGRLQQWLFELRGKAVPVHAVEQGQCDPDWLMGKASAFKAKPASILSLKPAVSLGMPSTADITFPECGYVSFHREQDGFYASGWVFDTQHVFTPSALESLINETHVVRLKGVFITQEGAVAYNKAEGVINTMALASAKESRIELIATEPDVLKTFEQKLLGTKKTT